MKYTKFHVHRFSVYFFRLRLSVSFPLQALHCFSVQNVEDKILKQQQLSKADGKIISNIFKPLKRKPLTEESTSSSPQEAGGFMGNVDLICWNTGTNNTTGTR